MALELLQEFGILSSRLTFMIHGEMGSGDFIVIALTLYLEIWAASVPVIWN